MADVVEGTGDIASREFELPEEPAAPADEVPAEAPDGEAAVSEETAAATESAEEEAPIPPESTPRSLDEVPAEATDGSTPAKKSSWLDKIIHPAKKHAQIIANHPFVNTMRQRAGAATGAAQDRMQPIVNHPYVQKGHEAIKAGGTRTLETGKKVYNNEPGYEPKRFAPLFAATVGLIFLGLLIQGFAKRYYGQKDEL